MKQYEITWQRGHHVGNTNETKVKKHSNNTQNNESNVIKWV